MRLIKTRAVIIAFEEDSIRCSTHTGFDTLEGPRKAWQLKAGDKFSEKHGVVKSIVRDGKIKVWK